MKSLSERSQFSANAMPLAAPDLVPAARFVSMIFAGLFLIMLAPGVAVSQSASFAFGQGGFTPPEESQEGVFNECLGSIEGSGASTCDGITHKYGGYGQTYLDQQTEVQSGYAYRPNGSLVRAAATYDRYGFGASAATCTLSRNNGMTNCASGAYGSANGASAKLSLSSTR